jgi:hypothetical protein
MKTKAVELEDVWEHESVLQCMCGGNNLHHYGVTVFDRDDDSSTVRVTNVTHTGTSSEVVPNELSGNPSARRDAVVVRFWCEHCGHEYGMQIVQHKGCTYLSWRDLGKMQDGEHA